MCLRFQFTSPPLLRGPAWGLSSYLPTSNSHKRFHTMKKLRLSLAATLCVLPVAAQD